ncbi:MAG: O-antigen ligase family protein [Chloroflexota bacterium]
MKLPQRISGLQHHIWSPRLLNWLIIAAVLLLSASFARPGYERLVRLVALAGLGFLVILFFLRQPAWGLLLLIAAGPLVHFEIGTGTESRLNATMLILVFLVGVWVLDMLVIKRQLGLVYSPPLAPLTGLGIIAILSFFIGQLTLVPLANPASLASQLGGVALYLFAIAAFVWTYHQVKEIHWLQRATWIFLALGAVYILGQLKLPLLNYVSRFFHIGSIGSLFWVWLVALSFSQALFNSRLGIKWRLANGALAAAALYIGLFPSRSWASGWMPPLIAVIAILFVALPRLRWLLLGAAVFVFVQYSQSILNYLNSGVESYSYSTRIEAWRVLADLIRINPLTGLGPSNYYFYVKLYALRGYYVSFNSHNQYVDLVAQTGLLGLFFFLWFAWRTWRLGWKLIDKAPPGFARAYVFGALGGLAGTLAAGMLGDWVIPFVYNIGFRGFRASVLGWIFLGGLAALDLILKQPASETNGIEQNHLAINAHAAFHPDR